MKIFLFGDSLFDNGAYVGNGPTVTASLEAMWSAGVERVARDAHVISSIPYQWEEARRIGLNPAHDAVVVGVSGKDFLNRLHLWMEPCPTIADGLLQIHEILSSFYATYTAMVDEMVARGCRHLVLTTIYPVFDMQRIEYMVTSVPTRVSKTWALTSPIINLMNSHIRAEAKRVGAKVVDLYHSDIEPNDIVFGIEPGPTASPKIAQAIVKARRVS